jgi:3-oxoacyl-[acyl-carrier protein] reductase
MDLGLRNRRCLVTGAGSGIGRGIALALAAEGAHLAIAARNERRLYGVASEVVALGAPRPVVITADLATPDGVDLTAEAARHALGAVEVLINNAGGSRPLPAQPDQAFWDESFALNFTAARRLTEALLPAMRAAKWGRVVNVAGALAAKAINAAAPAKAALVSWSRSLASEVAADGVTVNCVAPGRIHSVQILTRLHPTEESRRAYIEQNIPAGRFGEPEELAALVAFLASAKAGYISGVLIPVDGGLHRIDMR